MARRAKADDKKPSGGLVGNLINAMNKKSTSTSAYVQGDHAENTWGVPIPYLAFQWLLGVDIMPMQRYFGVSGEEKSFKSTLTIEIGSWYILAGGVHVYLDAERKTSATMLDAMTWHREDYNPEQRVYKLCRSINEWQQMVSEVLASVREQGASPPGAREPVNITVDSLSQSTTEGQQETLVKEGEAAERGYPVGAAKVTYFLEQLSLLGTTASMSWVQHTKAGIEANSYGGVEMREKGAKAAQFACSNHVRVARTRSTVRYASHGSAIDKGIPVEGYELFIKNTLSSVGPSGRVLNVEVLWQYLPQPPAEDGTATEDRQAMWFDWYGALGQLLVNMKYNDKFKPKQFAHDKDRLNSAIMFTQPRAGIVKCEALGLEAASLTEFGRAIEENPDVRKRVSDFLGIKHYPSVQEADIDFEANNRKAEGKKVHR